MVDNIIRLDINTKEFLQLSLPCAEDSLTAFDFVDVSYQGPHIQHILFADNYGETALVRLEDALKLALEDKLNLDASLSLGLRETDIGYLSNIYSHKMGSEYEYEIHEKSFEQFLNKNLTGKTYFVCTKNNNEKQEWIGLDYQLWSGKGAGPQTWLYNKSGKIILEISPSYKWHYRDPEPNEQAISYEEFMQSYKPLVITEISKETAGKWLIKTRELLNTIDTNTLKLRPGCSRP